jgi:hypothetical protein
VNPGGKVNTRCNSSWGCGFREMANLGDSIYGDYGVLTSERELEDTRSQNNPKPHQASFQIPKRQKFKPSPINPKLII